VLLATTPGRAQEPARTPDQSLARDILAELIAINTTHDQGNHARRRGDGPAARGGRIPSGRRGGRGPRVENRNLVARLRGSGQRRPILLLAHLDVVEALAPDWSLDPFTLTERDGFFYGRGTSDIKDMAAIFVATLVRLKREGFVPDRDIILALTAGEESSADYNGVQWLLANRRDLIDAVYCINGDAGDPLIRDGKRIVRAVEASEKVYQDFQLEVRSPGGHSSLPVPDNAIYRLAAALERLGRFESP
jgi:acetylornithine deacetylase/succinyl-diaminopimelate desuccinylase-like protein